MRSQSRLKYTKRLPSALGELDSPKKNLINLFLVLNSFIIFESCIIHIFLKDTVFISFFTPNGRYPELAIKLKKSLDKFSLKSHIVKINRSFRTWEEGTYYKPSFIFKCLLKSFKSLLKAFTRFSNGL